MAVVFALLLATILLEPVAERVRLPAPVLVTLFGVAFSFLPHVEPPHIDPDLILPLLLPPLINAATYKTSWRQFVANVRPILLLAVALVFVTTGAVAFALNAVDRPMPVMAAVALGAIVSPPDPVAAVAVAGKLHLPRRIVTLLEGEGLFNDVAALTVYQVAVNAVVTGQFSTAVAIGTFLYEAAAAVALGLALGWLASHLFDWLPSASLESALSLVVPFAAYLAAERLHCSGVLAVLVTALYLRHNTADADNVAGRLQGRAFWDVIELLVTGFGFGLIGMELRSAFDADSGRQALTDAAVVCSVVIVVRFLWWIGAAWVVNRRVDPDEETTRTWQETVVAAWAGMRGVATVATALALPYTINDGSGFPERSRMIVAAFSVVIVTLLVQGLTLPALVRVLGVREKPGAADEMERQLFARAAHASLTRLSLIEQDGDLPDEVVEPLRAKHQAVLASCDPAYYDMSLQLRTAERMRERKLYRDVEADLLAAARAEVLAARREPGVDPVVADRVLGRIDRRSLPLL